MSKDIVEEVVLPDKGAITHQVTLSPSTEAVHAPEDVKRIDNLSPPEAAERVVEDRIVTLSFTGVGVGGAGAGSVLCFEQDNERKRRPRHSHSLAKSLIISDLPPP